MEHAAYAAVTSIAVIGLYIAYVMPTFLRLRQGENFQRGPWHLGRWSYVVGWIAVTWVVIITILFMLPQCRPDHLYELQLHDRSRWRWSSASPGSTGWSRAKNWFKGPRVQGTAEELAAIERELAS